MIDQRPLFFAERDGHRVGMVAGGFNEEYPDTWWLYSMYVTPAARGTSAATQLVDAVCAWARSEGATSLYLHVMGPMARARAFYKKVGFVETGEQKALERDPSLVLYTLARPLGDVFRVERVGASALHELRCRVLRNNNPDAYTPDPRDESDTARHFAGRLNDRVVVSASFFPATSPVRPELASTQLRFMATDVEVQGRGYGAQVLQFALDALATEGYEQVWANARDTALGFYLATGWDAIEGSAHLSAETQLPHTQVVKLLVTATSSAP